MLFLLFDTIKVDVFKKIKAVNGLNKKTANTLA